VKISPSCASAIASVLITIGSVGWLGCSSETHGTAANGGEKQLALDFTLPDLTGKSISLSDYRGKTVIVDFWATWCAPCVYQIPVLNSVWEKHRDRDDLVVLGISVDVDGEEVVGPWIAEKNVTYPILLGEERLAQQYGVLGFPTLVVIRSDGFVESMHVGLIEEDELEELIDAAQTPRPS